jgi:acyl-CoA thioesterase FadM
MIETPQVIQCSVGMRWGDMDAYGHVNNVEILRILEEARIHAFGPPGGTGGPGREPVVALFNNVPAGTQALVAEHRVKYLSPLTYRNIPADIAVWISALKGASLTIAYVRTNVCQGGNHPCLRRRRYRQAPADCPRAEGPHAALSWRVGLLASALSPASQPG